MLPKNVVKIGDAKLVLSSIYTSILDKSSTLYRESFRALC